MPIDKVPVKKQKALKAEKTKKEDKLTVSERFARLGLVRDWDFVFHLPLRYEDETQITDCRALTPGTFAQVQGRITEVIAKRTSGFVPFTFIRITDASGAAAMRLFRFGDKKLLTMGSLIRAYGEVRLAYSGEPELWQPRVKKAVADVSDLPKTLTPVYPASGTLTQPVIRKRIDRALLDVDLKDLVPEKYTKALNLPGFAEAVRFIHHPSPLTPAEALSERTAPEFKRLVFDEFLAQQIFLKKSRDAKALAAAPAMTDTSGALKTRFLDSLAFTLTGAQQRVISEIEADMATKRPMQRLVAGDVGSGKTVIAALAAVRAVENGFQAAVMAPTEILAHQHYKKLSAWLTPLGVNIVFLAGSLSGPDKKAALKSIADGTAQIAVGTHALIQEGVHFKNLGLAVIDEQHRFGVSQRMKLALTDAGVQPHQLLLTATPIPRTLAMSYLADIDVSFLDEMPPGRQPVTTKLISLSRAADVLKAVTGDIREGRQCYWVCPLIEESEQADLTAATDRERMIRESEPDLRTALLHSKLPAEEKEAVMARFAAGEIDILVSTTVIEVGVDVPNASVMVIEHAERFGLSQLHQLRGRVGRGTAKSTCLMLFDPELSDVGKERLRVIRETTDGFAVAREDLRLRGPGEFLGARQSGSPAMRFADPLNDKDLLEWARRSAEDWMREDAAAAEKFASRWFDPARNFLQA